MAEDVVVQRRRGSHADAREVPVEPQVERRQCQAAQAAAGHAHHPHRTADRSSAELIGKLQAGVREADHAGQLREQLVVHDVRHGAGAPQPLGHAARQIHVARRLLVVQQVHGRAQQVVDQAVALHRHARRVAQEDVVAKAGADAAGSRQPRVVGVVAHDVDHGVGAGAPYLRHQQLHVPHLVAAEGQAGEVLALDQHRAAQLPAQARRRLQRGGVGAERQPWKALQPRTQLLRVHGLCKEPDEVLAPLAYVDDLNIVACRPVDDDIASRRHHERAVTMTELRACDTDKGIVRKTRALFFKAFDETECRRRTVPRNVVVNLLKVFPSRRREVARLTYPAWQPRRCGAVALRILRQRE